MTTTLLPRPAESKAEAAPAVVATVYTREQCCCCHAAIEVLGRYRSTHGLVVEAVDVDSDPALAEAHGPSVPVVAIDGRVRFRGLVNPVLLERLLKARASAG